MLGDNNYIKTICKKKKQNQKPTFKYTSSATWYLHFVFIFSDWVKSLRGRINLIGWS